LARSRPHTNHDHFGSRVQNGVRGIKIKIIFFFKVSKVLSPTLKGRELYLLVSFAFKWLKRIKETETPKESS